MFAEKEPPLEDVRIFEKETTPFPSPAPSNSNWKKTIYQRCNAIIHKVIIIEYNCVKAELNKQPS